MEVLFSQLSAYNILNSVIPGAVIYYLFELLFGIKIDIELSLVGEICVFYICGVIIGRIASLIVKPIAKEIKLVKYAPLDDYLYAESKDPKVGIISETNDNYRNIFTLFLIVAIRKIFSDGNIFLELRYWSMETFILIGIIILFALSYRKQTGFVRKRVEYICRNRKED